MKDETFRALTTKDRKAATSAYNDRSLFEESEALILDEENDTVESGLLFCPAWKVSKSEECDV